MECGADELSQQQIDSVADRDAYRGRCAGSRVEYHQAVCRRAEDAPERRRWIHGGSRQCAGTCLVSHGSCEPRLEGVRGHHGAGGVELGKVPGGR